MTAYRGTPVSAGLAAGEAYLPDVPAGTGAGTGPRPTLPAGCAVTVDDVRAAFAAVAAERHALADRLRAAGRDDEADIVAIGALIAADPALSGPALSALTAAVTGPTAVRSERAEFPQATAGPGTREPSGRQVEQATVTDDRERVPLATAAAAITAAAQTQAGILAALPDPGLAQRASDVRQVATAVIARLAGGATVLPPPESAFILIRADVDPADLIRLAGGGNLVGAVSVGGGASSHAAIIARGLGLPMLAGADPAVLAAPAGHPAILDAGTPSTGTPSTGTPSTGTPSTGTGELLTDPSPGDWARAVAAPAAPATGGAAAWLAGPGQARTADGEAVTVLCNVASAAEARLGLANGAAGIGLLRTEIPFARAAGWPSRADHLAALTPVLRLLRGKRAVVRLLDFAGDKVPPFPGAAGLPAFLRAPGALTDQLTAILEAGAGTDLAIMIPMVASPGEVDLVRAELGKAASAAGVHPPPLGMMVELAVTAAAAPAFAGHADFFSIGTNDLTADVLRRDRSALRPADAAERLVLIAVATTVRAAREAAIGLSVCGDAAADPAVLPLLLSLGVRTVSVGAAKVPAVARWIAQADTGRPAIPDAG